jgi:hypothetical protein
MPISPLAMPVNRLARPLAALLRVLLVLLLAAPAWAGTLTDGPLASGTAPKGQPLAGVLNPDGTLKTGLNGSFDASGYRMRTAPDGKPVFRPAGTTGAGDENWQDGFGVNGTNGALHTLVQSGTDTYIGGSFTVIGTVAANHIAKWNGSSWSALGPGMNGSISALALDGSGNLYAGGYFSTAGGVAANHYCQVERHELERPGTGVSHVVWALVVSGGEVYAGGAFTTAGGSRPTTLPNGTAHAGAPWARE